MLAGSNRNFFMVYPKFATTPKINYILFNLYTPRAASKKFKYDFQEES